MGLEIMMSTFKSDSSIHGMFISKRVEDVCCFFFLKEVIVPTGFNNNVKTAFTINKSRAVDVTQETELLHVLLSDKMKHCIMRRQVLNLSFTCMSQ